MNGICYFAATGSLFEIFLWLGILLVWVIVQMVNKASGQKTAQRPPSSGQTGNTDLDNFLGDMLKRGEEPVEEDEEWSRGHPPQVPVKETVFEEHIAQPEPLQAEEKLVPRAAVHVPIAVPAEVAQFKQKEPERPDLELIEHEHVPVKKLLFPATAQYSGRKTAQQSQLVPSLRSPATLRRAIVYREIIGLPKGLPRSGWEAYQR